MAGPRASGAAPRSALPAALRRQPRGLALMAPQLLGLLLLLLLRLATTPAAAAAAAAPDDPWAHADEPWPTLVATGWNVNELVPAGGQAAASPPAPGGGPTPRPPPPGPVLGEYPEAALLEGRPRSALCMSGGGTRAYISTLGYLRALLDMQLLNKTRYISSVSGGSWATAAFTYFQPSRVANLSEADFLGEILPPAQLTRETLQELNPRSARASPVNRDFLRDIFLKLFFSGLDPHEIYTATVQDVFLTPAGIPAAAQVSLTPDLLADQVDRNPVLRNETFIFPCEGKPSCYKPFALLNAAILGPKLAAPYSTLDNNYVPIEFSALYVGSPQHHDLHYTVRPHHGTLPKLLNFTVGGMVETFAFGGSMRAISTNGTNHTILPPPVLGLGPNQYSSTLKNVPVPQRQFGLANMSSASSFAPGSILSGSPLLKRLDQTIGLEVSYWSPVTSHPHDPVFSSTAYIADAASLENNGLLPMLRRKMEEIVVFIHSPTPLKPRSHFNPFKRAPRASDVDPAFSCYFGVDHEIPNVFENLGNNQVFPRFQLARILARMQRAQQIGRGIVVRTALRTVENTYWGIPAGHAVNITWVYLGRATAWEDQLPAETRREVRPFFEPSNPANLPLTGPYAFFPHFPTPMLHFSPEQANLLANLAGWVVQQHSELFRLALDRGAHVARSRFPSRDILAEA